MKNHITSFTLHIFAMCTMLIDHIGAILFPTNQYLRLVGRLSFPIFAFMIVEGFNKTSNKKKYLFRIFLFALVSEIPYDYVFQHTLLEYYKQNILFTFAISLIFLFILESLKTLNILTRYITSFGIILIAILVGELTGISYGSVGILTVIIFYFFQSKFWYNYIIQFVLLTILFTIPYKNGLMTIELFGCNITIIIQSLAVMSLIPIWLYNGKQGYNKTWFKYFCYSFYPVHLSLLYGLKNICI